MCIRDRFQTFSTAHSPESGAAALQDLLCCLPLINGPESLGYERVFRVLIVQFLDPQSFDVRSVKRSCIHFAQPDGRMIPFDTFNLFYRGERERAVLANLRANSPER